MLLLICVRQHLKEKIQDGKYRLLGDLCPAYIMNIQSLGVKKRIVWGIWKLEAAYSHDSVTTQARKCFVIAVQDVFKGQMESGWPKLKTDTGCKVSHPSPSHSQSLSFFKYVKCFNILIPQIAADEASLMVPDYVDGLTGCRMPVFHCYSLVTAVQRAGARLSWDTSAEFLMVYSLAHHNDLACESTHGNFHHQQKVLKSCLRHCRVCAFDADRKEVFNIWVWPLFSTSHLFSCTALVRAKDRNRELKEPPLQSVFSHAKSKKT